MPLGRAVVTNLAMQIKPINGRAVGKITDAADPAALKAVVAACWTEAEALEARWAAALSGRRPRSGGQGAFTRSWARLNHVAGVQRL